MNASTNVGLELAVKRAWTEWANALEDALIENNTTGTVSEYTMARVEALEEKYNQIVEAKRAAHGA